MSRVARRGVRTCVRARSNPASEALGDAPCAEGRRRCARKRARRAVIRAGVRIRLRAPLVRRSVPFHVLRTRQHLFGEHAGAEARAGAQLAAHAQFGLEEEQAHVAHESLALERDLLLHGVADSRKRAEHHQVQIEQPVAPIARVREVGTEPACEQHVCLPRFAEHDRGDLPGRIQTPAVRSDVRFGP